LEGGGRQKKAVSKVAMKIKNKVKNTPPLPSQKNKTQHFFFLPVVLMGSAEKQITHTHTEKKKRRGVNKKSKVDHHTWLIAMASGLAITGQMASVMVSLFT
jgi:hypothetical protein